MEGIAGSFQAHCPQKGNVNRGMLTSSQWRSLPSSISSSHWVCGGRLKWCSSSSSRPQRLGVHALSSEQTRVANTYNMNLSEYMLTLEKPLGIRFAQTLDGKVYVEALAKHGNAESSRMIMVGDVLKKTSAVFGDAMWDVEDFSRTMHAIKKRSGSVSLVLERPATPARIHPLLGKGGPSFNCGRVGLVTWNGENVAIDPELFGTDVKHEGKSGFLMFSSRFLRSRGFKALVKWKIVQNYMNGPMEGSKNGYGGKLPTYEVVNYFSDEETDGEVEWTHGNFSLEDYTSALKRSEKDLSYNHSLGMQVTKITGEIFVGSCLQTVADASNLAKDLGITAVLNLQCKSEQTNWNIDGESIKQTLSQNGVLSLDFPVREVDSVDLRRKLPCAIAVLYRLLRQGHRVYVTCTTGLDRSPACVIAYLHWIRDVALQDAFDFVQSVHRCGPDRPALVWATWDLVAMAEKGNHEGPATHTVQFVWNHGCREGEEVLLVGDFKGEWNEPIKAVHAGGPKYIVDLRLPQGKYYFKFIVEGQWRHSHSLPTEVDRWGNVNNVIHIGGVATTNFNPPTGSNMKAPNNIKVIERPLTENERFTLAFAARRMAFSICPIRFSPKS
ncbi:hypothetical protein GOP47_0006086 [Adiantum capillus-veneris]|uniref:Tyrosine-protein phosphatase domain-containing protein n=1 Tax=Adiantum capillus-veneris TaxID=13818 RepID=A0A9D4ZMQ3_ADICA|nr:hypothetical protein GOP47_0006086 [Adiantum capillus-veneris]